jgi:hypothetical protein
VSIQPTLAAGAQASATASCPSGKKALGGGFSTGGDYFTVRESRSINFGAGWSVIVKNNGLSGAGWAAYAVCATVS